MFKFSHKRGERRYARDTFWGEGGRGRGGRGFGRHRGGGRGRRGRVFDQGDLRLIVLSLMAEAPRHGYELIKAIEDLTNDAYSPSPGVMYPTLQLLEDAGFASVGSADGSRKAYAITADGKAYLESNRAVLETVQARAAQLRDGSASAPQIERAVDNLRSAMRLRIERGLNAGEAQAIADALDAAAKAIEKI